MNVSILDSVVLFMKENKINANILKPYIDRLRDNPYMYKLIDENFDYRAFTCKNLTFSYIVNKENKTIYIVDVMFLKSSIKFKIK